MSRQHAAKYRRESNRQLAPHGPRQRPPLAPSFRKNKLGHAGVDQSGSSADLRALRALPLDLNSLTSCRRSASATSPVYTAEFRDPTQGYNNIRLSAGAAYRAMFDNDQVVNMGSSSSAKAIGIASNSGQAATAQSSSDVPLHSAFEAIEQKDFSAARRRSHSSDDLDLLEAREEDAHRAQEAAAARRAPTEAKGKNKKSWGYRDHGHPAPRVGNFFANWGRPQENRIRMASNSTRWCLPDPPPKSPRREL